MCPRSDEPEHEPYADWLNRTSQTDSIGLADTILSGFVRIVTHPRIMPVPAPIDRAIEFTTALTSLPTATWLSQGASAWERFARLTADDPGVRGNLVPDAHIAALCLANGASLATRDRGFARFSGLRFFDPARP